MVKKQSSLICASIILLLINQHLFAQQDSVYNRWAEFAEEDAEIIELVQQLTDNPINLNKAEHSDFSRIPFLTQAHIEQILQYRNQNKRFKSRRPLHKILGKELYTLLKPFFSIRDIRKNSGYLKQKFQYPIDPGSAVKKYRGEPWSSKSKLYFAREKTLKIGLVTQKDVGEPNPIDYLSGYVSYNKTYWQAIAGRYHFRFGHGLAYANPFANQKSAMVLNPLRSLKTSAAPSLSSAENNGLFGACLKAQPFETFNLVLFTSVQNLDARFSRKTDKIIGIDYDGYHRTDSELEAKNNLAERITGFSASQQINPSLKVSGLISHNTYNPKIHFGQPDVSESDLRRQYYHFSGKGLKQLSLHYTGQIKAFNLSGEMCTSDQGSPGYSQKILILAEHIQFGGAYWWLSKNYQAPHGGVFNHTSNFPQAQQGLYLAAQTELGNGLTFKAYKFFTKDLWRGYFESLPQVYDEWFIETSYTIPDRIIRFQLRDKKQTQTAAPAYGQKIYRLDYEWEPNWKLRLKLRLARTNLEQGKENGTYFFQDFKYALTKHTLFYTRVTFFQTTSFKSALYEYENDLPGSFANYPLYGQGHKWYLMARVSFTDHFRLWMKLRYLRRTNPDSGISTLSRDLRFQVDWFI